MKKAVFLNPLKISLQIILLLAISFFNLGASSANIAYASTPKSTDSCGQQLADAKAKFMALLPADGSVPATPEVRAAAAEYIHVSKLCYYQIQGNNSSATLQAETSIDNGGMVPGNNTASANFQTTGQTWSTSTITYSFMPSGISFSGISGESSGAGKSLAVSQLPTFQPCFITDIQNAFAAWQAVANIHFKQVTDNGAAFDAAGATGDIRIAAHAFDGPYGILAHAYFPPPSGYAYSDAGDLHFDSAENWTCNTSGIDIGMVALHEIGHSLGLDHQTAPPTAVMNPTYNPNLTGLQTDDINGIRSLYGAAAISSVPGNDNFANATTIPGISYTDTLDIGAATIDTTGTPPDPDNIGPCTDVTDPPNLHFNKINNSVWYKYTTGAVPQSISVDTQGSTNAVGGDLDTFLAVWTLSGSTLNLVTCNDDDYTGNTSKLSFLSGTNTTYYFEAGNYNCYYGVINCGATTGGNLIFNVKITNTDVLVNNSLMKSYYLDSGNTVGDAYAGTVNGPMHVSSLDSTARFTSERVHNSKGFVNELMGFPNSQLTTEYWFPWYDNVYMQSWILVGNPSTTTDAHVHIYIAGVEQLDSPYTIKPGKNITPTYTGIVNGPVHITSDINVFTSERVHTGQGFVNEVFGIPNNQLTTEYWFTWYDNVYMQSWILVGNPSTTTDAHVHIYIAGVEQLGSPYTIKPGQNITPIYTGIVNGPVHITSDINVFTTERVHNATGFINEVAGMPNNKLNTQYWFPWYDNQTMQSWILVGNPSTTTNAHVHIYIAGVEQTGSPFTVQAGKNITPTFAVLNGPVHIVSDINVFTSERVHTGQGFVNEAMGIPNNQLTTDYWFPWYDNVYMQSWILIGKP